MSARITTRKSLLSTATRNMSASVTNISKVTINSRKSEKFVQKPIKPPTPTLSLQNNYIMSPDKSPPAPDNEQLSPISVDRLGGLDFNDFLPVSKI